MKLEDFVNLPRIPFKEAKLVVGPIIELGEITPSIGAEIPIYLDGIKSFQSFSRQHSYNPNEPRQHLVYVMGIIEEERLHNFVFQGPKEISDNSEIQEIIKKMEKKSYSLAYSEGRKKDKSEAYTVHLIKIEDIEDYRTITRDF